MGIAEQMNTLHPPSVEHQRVAKILILIQNVNIGTMTKGYQNILFTNHHINIALGICQAVLYG